MAETFMPTTAERKKTLQDWAIEELNKACQKDNEKGHMMADQVLCDLLAQMGFLEVVKKFHDMEKWYS